jgi:hypothetical protein
VYTKWHSHYCISITLFFFVVLGFELKVYTFSHSTSPFVWWIFLR